MEGEEEETMPNVPYQTTVRDSARYHSITMMQVGFDFMVELTTGKCF